MPFYNINSFFGKVTFDFNNTHVSIKCREFKVAVWSLSQSLATEGPLKIMRNAFCFTLKAFLVLKTFKFVSWIFGHAENGLIRKIRLTSKFMTSQPGQQTIAKHILVTILRKAIRQWNWVNCNRNIFLKNHTQNVVKILFSDPFLKNQNWAYLWINSLSFIQFVFIVCQVKDPQNILKLNCRPLVFTSYKAFLKKVKWDLELVFLPHFLPDFRRQIFLFLLSPTRGSRDCWLCA